MKSKKGLVNHGLGSHGVEDSCKRGSFPKNENEPPEPFQNDDKKKGGRFKMKEAIIVIMKMMMLIMIKLC